nr:tRNA lysidine(34) synthetase TilS [Pseudomonadota bacterium]
ARGIEHIILPWIGDKPSSRIQESAREARYRLLSSACRNRGILHLAVAHHRDDQEETVRMRLDRNSGDTGLAGMSAVRPLPHGRLIRPLLAVPKSRLQETCRHYDQPWIEDPSNQSPAFDRARIRKAKASADLWDMAQNKGLQRRDAEQAMALFFAGHAAIYPEGWMTLDRTALMALPEEDGCRVLARCVTTIGGLEYPPHRDSTRTLWQQIRQEPARAGALGNCLLTYRKDRLVICRELSREYRSLTLPLGREPVLWDNRILITCANPPAGPLWISPLGPEGWQTLKAAGAALPSGLPGPVRHGLPWAHDRAGALVSPDLMTMAFCPPVSLCGTGFRVALP